MLKELMTTLDELNARFTSKEGDYKAFNEFKDLVLTSYPVISKGWWESQEMIKMLQEELEKKDE